MHLYQEYHSSSKDLLLGSTGFQFVSLLMFNHFDNLNKVTSARCFHCKVTIFPFTINKCFVEKYFEIMLTILVFFISFHLFIYLLLINHLWVHSVLFCLTDASLSRALFILIHKLSPTWPVGAPL